MIIETLNQLWEKKKRSLGKRLQKGIQDLAYVLKPIAEKNNYSQQILDNEILWLNRDDKIEVLFFYIFDPRNFEMVAKVYHRVKETQCELACIFVHQWKDGEGNWDVFGLHPQRGLVHWNRFWGNRWLTNDTGPFFREDIYTLFACGQDFPALSSKKWLKLLNESGEKTKNQISLLASDHGCSQDKIDNMVRWKNSDGQIEVIFSFYQGFPSLDDYIRIFDQIKVDKCPVTFLFQRAHPDVFDIFRFTARSFMEHHNQVK